MTSAFTFDWESFLIQPGKHVPKGVCASMSFSDMLCRDPKVDVLHANFDRSTLHDMLEHALKNTDVINGANLAFDMAVAWQEFPHLADLIWKAYADDRCVDGLLNEKLVDIAKGQLGMHYVNLPNGTGKFVAVRYNLGDIAQRRLGVLLEKEIWRLKYGTLWKVRVKDWDPGAIQYSEFDTRYAQVLFADQASQEGHFLADAHRQARAGFWMHLMSCRGFRVNGRAIDKLESYVQGELNKLIAYLSSFDMVDKGGKRNTKVAAARMLQVCTAKGITPPRTEPSDKFPEGQVQLTDASCAETNDPLLMSYARYTSLNNIMSKDVKALKAAALAGQPIQSTFDVLKETGRTGSSGGKKKKGVARTAYGYQLQNVRRDLEDTDGTKLSGVRECFVPREGFHLLSIDYGQMELHAFAQVCMVLLGYSKLGEALNAGIDVHSKLGADMIGRPYEEVFANKTIEAWAKEARQMAKAGNFGFPGGLGVDSFIAYAKATYGVILSPEQAKKLRDVWMSTWAEAGPYFKLVKSMIDRSPHGGIIQLYSERYRGNASFTKSANGLFQGLAADCAKDAGFKLTRECYSTTGPLSGCFIVDFIHDEFLFEVPIHKAHEAAWAANDIMEATGKIWMPDAPPRSEPALMHYWTKEAKMVKDENGRLIPSTKLIT